MSVESRDCKLFVAKVNSYDCDLLAETVTWCQSETEDLRALKNMHEGTISDVLDALQFQLQPFLAHCFIKR